MKEPRSIWAVILNESIFCGLHNCKLAPPRLWPAQNIYSAFIPTAIISRLIRRIPTPIERGSAVLFAYCGIPIQSRKDETSWIDCASGRYVWRLTGRNRDQRHHGAKPARRPQPRREPEDQWHQGAGDHGTRTKRGPGKGHGTPRRGKRRQSLRSWPRQGNRTKARRQPCPPIWNAPQR